MFKLILTILFFLCSLLTVLPVPAHQVWYVGVAVTEFSWVFLVPVLLLIIWSFRSRRYRIASILFSVAAFVLFCFPIAGAYKIARNLDHRLEIALGVKQSDLTGFHKATPFSFTTMLTGDGASEVPSTSYHYTVHTGVDLTLNYYAAKDAGFRPCLVVVHGGSWAKGDNHELPNVNSYFANCGYHVVSINYRLAPTYKSPAPQEDLKAALAWLREHAIELKIDTSNFVLMGRSAGGQLVLASAYTFNDPGIKGVISFYGPTDMLWSYDHPDNPLIMDSKKVLRDYFGGEPAQFRENYIAASPMDHVNAATIPTLLVHGGNDAHVWLRQSQMLQKKLEEYHVKNFLLALPWATHGCEYKLSTPSGQLAAYSVERFLYAVTHK